MNDSEYLKWRRALKFRSSAEQDAKCLDAEARGLRFMIDFGILTSPSEIRTMEILKGISRVKAHKAAS